MIVFINGCFDVLHRGHIELFKYAKSLGDRLIIGIDSDKRVSELKGHLRPINSEEDRKFFLESIQYIDKVDIFSSEDQLRDLVWLYQPDIMVVGSDYKGKDVIGSEFAKNLIFIDRIGDYSTTNILERK